MKAGEEEWRKQRRKPVEYLGENSWSKCLEDISKLAGDRSKNMSRDFAAA
jgi:hypothetical protein